MPQPLAPLDGPKGAAPAPRNRTLGPTQDPAVAHWAGRRRFGRWGLACCGGAALASLSSLLAGCATPSAGAGAAAGTRPAPADAADGRVRLEPVAPGVWLAQGAAALGSRANRNHISNAVLLDAGAALVVVDALGAPVLADELIQEAARVAPGKPIREVIVTHYHADHVYGLQRLAATGATVWAHQDGREYLHSDTARQRLAASREALSPFIDARTELTAAQRWIAGETALSVGSLRLVLRPVGPAHTAEDLTVWLPQSRVLVAGDLVFRGRIPYVGTADSGRWIVALDGLLALGAEVVLPGHGPAIVGAQAVRRELQTTRDYLAYLRQTMGAAAREMEPFDEVYARTDWSRFSKLPLFEAANRINAYNTYLLMERQPGP